LLAQKNWDGNKVSCETDRTDDYLKCK
jgi:hypothetical protein